MLAHLSTLHCIVSCLNFPPEDNQKHSGWHT